MSNDLVVLEKEIIKPSASTRHRFMLEGDKSPLDHPRKVLWKWLITYLKPMQLKFLIYFIFLFNLYTLSLL